MIAREAEDDLDFQEEVKKSAKKSKTKRNGGSQDVEKPKKKSRRKQNGEETTGGKPSSPVSSISGNSKFISKFNKKRRHDQLPPSQDTVDSGAA